MVQGPRIYNLFPLLAGSISDWQARLPHIAAMGFDWIYLNPFHFPGFSGSLYAVKDYYRLHPLLSGDHSVPYEQQLQAFLSAAESAGIRVIMDLVINHTAKDALLVEQHPDWYLRDADGQIQSPFAVDPDDPSKVTVWGDLAEIDYHHPKDREGLLHYWKALVEFYTHLGFHGFRCDAAYKIPGDIWSEVIGAARRIDPDVHFFAETLGCRLAEISQLHSAGFDYLFNSSKWWDFRAGWLFEQYEMFRHVAPSIAFPESHDTERLAAETGGSIQESRLRYAFAAVFSAGVMMPMGYEFGFRKKLDVVHSRPTDIELPSFDITHFIADVNRVKARYPILNEEGPQRVVWSMNSPMVGILKTSEFNDAKLLIVINTDFSETHYFPKHFVKDVLTPHEASDITPGFDALPVSADSVAIAPRELRLLYGAAH